MQDRSGGPQGPREQTGYRLAAAFALSLATVILAGCNGRGNLPPVFGAVFGVTGAPVRPFTEGRLPETEVGPNARLVGSAASAPGQCIWQNEADRRFRAACPEGSDGLNPGR